MEKNECSCENENKRVRLNKKLKMIFFFRNPLFVIIFICLFLIYFINDFKAKFSLCNVQQNLTLLTKYSVADQSRYQLNNSESGFVWKLEDYESITATNYGRRHKSVSNETQLSRKLPGAIIIGVKKCGTRALLEYLRLHPDIKATGPEPHYFDRYYHFGLEWYRQKMPKSTPHQLTIEKTPRYFVKAEVPERIHKMSKTIKLILVVRNPVTRAISDFTQAVSKGKHNDTVTFKSKAIRRNGAINKKWSAIHIGLYASHLKHWLNVFPMESIHVVDGENLIGNPINELNYVQDFLGLERKIPEETIYMNVTKGFPCIRRQQRSPPFTCFRSSKGRQHTFIDEGTLALLTDFYKPFNEEFYKITNRYFNW